MTSSRNMGDHASSMLASSSSITSSLQAPSTSEYKAVGSSSSLGFDQRVEQSLEACKLQNPSTSQTTPPLTPVTNSQITLPMESQPPSNFYNYLRAFYHFHPTTTVSSVGEESSITVPINAGDIILVHSIQPNGWADGTVLASGARGWLPTNYCEHYDNDAISYLLNALTNAWEFIRCHENDEAEVFAKQDYVRSMIAGVRIFLERSKCLTRDALLVKEHVGIRRMRKGLLGDLSGFVKAAKHLQEKCIEPIDREHLWAILDDLVLKAFKLVTRAVRFQDIWAQDVAAKAISMSNDKTSTVYSPSIRSPATEEAQPNSATLPPTPPAEAHGSQPNTLDQSSRQVETPTMAYHLVDHSEQQQQQSSNFRSSLIGGPAGSLRRISIDGQRQQHRLSRPLSFRQHRLSASHRSSYNGKSLMSPKGVMASERLGTAHDAFLGHLGAFIGLHLQSRSSTELITTTQRSVESCRKLLGVVEEVWERDCRRSNSLWDAREAMLFKLEGLVQATRDVFNLANSSGEVDEYMPEQSANSLVDAATLCVRAAGGCVSKTKTVIERIGNFEFEVEPIGLGISEEPHTIETAPKSPEENEAARPEYIEAFNKPLPSPPLPSPPVHAQIAEQIQNLPLQPTTPPPPPPPPHTSSEDDESTTETQVTSPSASPTNEFVNSATPTPSNTRACAKQLTVQTSLSLRPTLDVEISHSPLLSGESGPNASFESTSTTPFDGWGPLAGDSTDTGSSTFRHSETSNTSGISTQATSPEQSPVKEKLSESNLNGSFASLSDSRSGLADPMDVAEAQFLTQTYAHELVFNKDGQITGGSLPALVERLTTHDSTPEATFVNTFYLTFRLFTTPIEFAQSLVYRFDYVVDSPDVATPVRLRVYNVFKGWVESHWCADTDNGALDIIKAFAAGRLTECLPSAGKRLLALCAKLSECQNGTLVPRLVSAIGKANTATSNGSAADGPLPNPSLNKSQLNLLKAAKSGVSTATIMDFDALELARQFTLIESKIFCSIQADELLALEWTKKKGSKAVNVHAMSTLSTDLANLVADTVLQLEEPKKRAVVIKQWVKIAKKCFELNNYDSLMAIICSLNSSMLLRLKKTWDLVPSKTMARLEQLKSVVDVSRNYAVLRQRLQNHVAPCLPFVGIYLTDLTFIDVGNQTTRTLPMYASADGRKYSVSEAEFQRQAAEGSLTECVSVINFDKHMRTAKIIGDLQRFQIPYRLTPVPAMQDWMMSQILRVRNSGQANVQSYYRKSLKLEPREQPPTLHHHSSQSQLQQSQILANSKGSPIDSANSSFSVVSSNTGGEKSATSSTTKEKFEFWSNFNFPLAIGSKEKVNG